MKSPGTEMRHGDILVNSSMWQSEEWTEATINVLSAEEIAGTKPPPSAFATAWRLFRRRRQVDIVSPSGADVALIYCLLCRLFLSKGPRQVLREILLVDPNPSSPRWRRRRWLRRFASKSVDAIIVNSRGERHIYASQFSLPEERFHFVPFHTNNQNPRFEQPGHCALAAGRSARDWQTFFEAIRGLDYPFVVVAGRTSVAAFDIPANVTLHCDIPVDEYLALIDRAAFMVVPLRDIQRSTGQVVILDGYAKGRPVVATRTVGTVDYVTDGETGLLCDPGSVDSMRTQIVRMIRDAETRCRMGQEALGCVASDYTFAVHVRRLLQVIRSAAPGPQSRRTR